MTTTPSIIAAGITTLDQARYFAAMGVSWLGFDMNGISTDVVNAITDWVIGPNFFAEYSVLNEEVLFEISNKTKIQGICIPVSASVPQWYSGTIWYKTTPENHNRAPQQASILMKVDNGAIDPNMLSEIGKQYRCWLEADISGMTEEMVSRLPDLNGLVIRVKGGVSEDTDSYELYDRFFERLETLDIHP